MNRTIPSAPRAMVRATPAVSSLMLAIEADAAGGPAHASELCHASLAARAWRGDESGVIGLMIRDSIRDRTVRGLEVSDAEIASAVDAIGGAL